MKLVTWTIGCSLIFQYKQILGFCKSHKKSGPVPVVPKYHCKYHARWNSAERKKYGVSQR